MITSFADQATGDLVYGDDTRAARRFPKTLWRRIQQKLIILDTASALKDLSALPGNRLEALRGGAARPVQHPGKRAVPADVPVRRRQLSRGAV